MCHRSVTYAKRYIMAAMAVVLASPSGPVGVVKGRCAVGSVLEEWSEEGSTHELVSTLVSNIKAGHRPAASTEAISRGIATERSTVAGDRSRPNRVRADDASG